MFEIGLKLDTQPLLLSYSEICDWQYIQPLELIAYIKDLHEITLCDFMQIFHAKVYGNLWDLSPGSARYTVAAKDRDDDS